MSSDPETTRIVRSWLDEGVTKLPDRVLDTVLDQIPATPQRRATWWPARRLSDMNTTLKLGLAAAVVAVAVLIGINFVGTSAVGGPDINSPTPTPSTPEPTPTATAVSTQSPAPENLLPEGPHALVDGEVVDEPPPMTVTIPAPDWYEWDPGTIVKNNEPYRPDGAWIVVFFGDLPVHEGPCDHITPATLATTVEELVAVLTAPPSRDATEPVDVTVDGYAGKSITLRVQDDAKFSDDGCLHLFGAWRTPGPPGEDYYRDPGTHQDRGLTDKLWILDVDGHLVVIDTVYRAGTSQEVVDEMEAIVGSITFGE